MLSICREDIDYFCVMHVTGNGLFSPQPKTPPRKGLIEFPAFTGPKKKPEPRLKGFGG